MSSRPSSWAELSTSCLFGSGCTSRRNRQVHCDHARYVYNLGLDQRQQRLDGGRTGPKVSLLSQCRELTRSRARIGWLRDGSAVVQQGALHDLDRAFANFFAGRAHYPTFKKAKDGRHGFLIRDLTCVRLNQRWATVFVPKIGPVRFRLTRPWSDVLQATSARVTLRNGPWHVSFTTPPPVRNAAGTGVRVGIDRGVANSVATSEGQLLHAPALTVGERRRFLTLQRGLSR